MCQHRAARGGHEATVELLIAAHADVNAGNVDDYTPLHVAAMQASRGRAVVACLLREGATTDARTKRGESALDLLELAGGDAATRALLEGSAIAKTTGSAT